MEVLEEPDLVWERVILDLFIVSIFVYYLIVGRYISPLLTSFISINYVGLVFPILLFSPWLIILLANYDELAYGILIFEEKMSILSVAHRIFYTLLFAIALYTLIIPLATPILVMSLAFYIPYLLATKLKKLKVPGYLVSLTYVLMVAFLAFFFIILLIPFYLIFVRESLSRSLSLLESIIPDIFSFSICIGASASVGDFILLIYQGAKEYDKSISIPYRGITCIQLILMFIFTAIVFLINHNYLTVISVSMFLSPLASLIRHYKGLIKGPLAKVDYYSGAIFLAFGLVNILNMTEFYKVFFGYDLKLPLILIATLMYGIILALSVITALQRKIHVQSQY